MTDPAQTHSGNGVLSFRCAAILALGAAVTAFGLYHIHDTAGITEGGILGLDLLIGYWFGLSPAWTNLLLTALAFSAGWKVLGRSFIIRSAIAAGAFSLFYRLLEHTPELFPALAEHPWLAAVIGALFVGLGTGLSVSEGGAQCGDDAVALTVEYRFGLPVSVTYLISDVTVLLFSLTYLPLRRILCSLLTVVLSGQIIELVLRIRGRKRH